MKLSNFTDWYIPENDPVSGYVYPGPIKIKENGNVIHRALNLVEICKEKNTEEFSIKDGGECFRGHRIDTVEGYVYSLRKVPNTIPEFARLGFDKSVQSLMLHKKLMTGGLVLVCGETGQGKSTTCSSFIKARLEKFGSFCLTLENPPEAPLHGSHGSNGICIQTDVKSGSFGEALRGAVRCYPTQGNSILFVGEIRDPETAGEALRIAVNGHLVISSLHGGDIISSLKRFTSLAYSYNNMSEIEARSLFSTSLRLVVQQRLIDLPGGKKMDAKILFSPGTSSPVANRIRQGHIDSLSTDVQQQEELISRGQIERLLDMYSSSGIVDKA